MSTHDVSIVQPKVIPVPSWLPGVLSFLMAGAIFYIALFSTYPPIHDTMHKVRHSLAIVPCH
jgi:cobalt transporter subunit CbtB